jgi:hypothetical protein
LWHNLAEYVEKTVAAHRGCLNQDDDTPPEVPAEDGNAVDLIEVAEAAHVERKENSALVARTKARYDAVQALKAQGKGIKPIMRELDLAKETVRKFYRADSVDELLAKPRAGRPSVLDAYKAYLHERWNAGCTNASTLYQEIIEQGYRGCRGTVAAYLAPFRALGAAPPATSAPPKVRHITTWMLRHPDDLDTEEQVKLKQVLASCPHLEATATHVRGFAEMLTGRHGERLEAWMDKVDADDLPHLHRFVRGLKRDYAAVLNGLTLPHSSGAVEGAVNRIILWNLFCQVHPCLPWFTGAIGSRVAVAGTPSSRGVVPAGVGTSISRSSSWSRAAWPSSTAACSSSVRGMFASICCRFSLASKSCPLLEFFGV